jgi:hypothetical protein
MGNDGGRLRCPVCGRRVRRHAPVELKRCFDAPLPIRVTVSGLRFAGQGRRN